MTAYRGNGGIPYGMAGLVARYDASVASSITQVTGVSQWNDLSGNGNNLLQATTTKQPLYLAYAGTNYGYIPNSSSNYFSTPNSSAITIGGNLAIAFDGALSSWTESGVFLVKKADNYSSEFEWYFGINSGYLNLLISDNGTYNGSGHTRNFQCGTAVSAGAGTYLAVGVTYIQSSGNISFWTAPSGTTTIPGGVGWTQIGSTGTGTPISTTFSSTSSLCVAGAISGLISGFYGNVLKTRVYNSTTLAASFDATAQANNATSWTATTGEVWTVNQSGALAAQIVGAPSVVTDAAAFFMAASFTLAQPVTIIFSGLQRTWVTGKYMLDGTSANTAAIEKVTSSPDIELNAGSGVATNSNLILGTFLPVSALFSGASSTLTVYGSAATTGSAGTGSPGGLTIGASGAGANFGSAQFQEILVYAASLSAATQNAIMAYLALKWGS